MISNSSLCRPHHSDVHFEQISSQRNQDHCSQNKSLYRSVCVFLAYHQRQRSREITSAHTFRLNFMSPLCRVRTSFAGHRVEWAMIFSCNSCWKRDVYYDMQVLYRTFRSLQLMWVKVGSGQNGPRQYDPGHNMVPSQFRGLQENFVQIDAGNLLAYTTG